MIQQGTPWMDGVSMISQCPILPGQTFEYRYKKEIFHYLIDIGLKMNLEMKESNIIQCFKPPPPPPPPTKHNPHPKNKNKKKKKKKIQDGGSHLNLY